MTGMHLFNLYPSLNAPKMYLFCIKSMLYLANLNTSVLGLVHN